MSLFGMKKISVAMLYDNKVGRFFLTEENKTLWSMCGDPYRDGHVSMATDDPDLDDDPQRAAYVRSVPMAKMYKQLLLQGHLVSPKFLNNLEKMAIRDEDIIITSYPRSGTTWTAEIVSAIMSNLDAKTMAKQIHERVFHLEVGRPVGQTGFLNRLSSPRLLETHLPFSHVPDQMKQLKCKVIYVVRNPKDQMVSYYNFHQHAKYLGNIQHDWNNFYQLYCNGHLVYGSWFEHVRNWIVAAKSKPTNVLILSYEDMKINLPAMVRLIAQFVGKDLPDETVRKIVEHCSFSKMKDNPTVNRTQIGITDFLDHSKQSFIRKGIIGDWQRYFTDEQNEHFDQLYKDKMADVSLRLAFSAEEAELLMKHSPTGRIVDCTDFNYNQIAA
ncbi:Sulfotransferase family cytosolic 1B member 1 [Halotydeus destructor]|nr:Sulfotransferase family cytosolic 1B member 1 [Halotydeus destructor]